MMSSDQLRKAHFRTAWLTWAALHHFLTAPQLRELLEVIAEQVSANSVSLADLFNERMLEGVSGLEAWALRQLPTSDGVADYLQHRFQHFVWQNDSDAYPPENDQFGAERFGSPSDLEAAVTLGRADFGLPHGFFRNIRGAESCLTVLRDLIELGSNTVRTSEKQIFHGEVISRVEPIANPLKTVIIKHMGDLCADADEWEKASLFYESAFAELERYQAEEWESLLASMRAIVTQSLATTSRVLEGPLASITLLESALSRSSLSQSPLIAMNVPFDLLNAQLAAGIFRGDSRRGTMLPPPLCSGSHDLQSTFEYLSEKKFNDAIRSCWAVLRRQLALGLAAETRETKAFYGRCLLALIEEESSQTGQKEFDLALRLLVEGGDRAKAQHIVWSNGLVDRFVRQSLVAHVIDIANRFRGTREERWRVLIEIYRGWLLVISADRGEVVRDMLSCLVAGVEFGGVSVISSENNGGRIFAILTEIAQARPEFRVFAVDGVFKSLQKRLTPEGFWKGRQLALELAIEYQDLFSDEQNREIIEKAIGILGKLNPKQNIWPVSRPIMRLLTSTPAAQLAARDPQLGKKIVRKIVDYGAEQDSDAVSMLFSVQSFDSALLRDPDIAEALMPAVSRLREHIKKPTSSAATDYMQALLLSPVISRADGISEAIGALRFVLQSPMKNVRCLSLAYAYAPLQMLIGREEEFAGALEIDRAAVDRRWREILGDLLALWHYAVSEPLVFAPFSLPAATVPNGTIVHNWAFVSAQFGKSLGEEQAVQNALDAAASNEQLKTSILSARAFGEADMSLQNLGEENAEVFYSALGLRISLLENLNEAERRNVVAMLLEQCFRHGPRELDLGVLICAREHGLTRQPDATLVSNYVKKIEANRELRLPLLPLILKLQLGPRQK